MSYQTLPQEVIIHRLDEVLTTLEPSLQTLETSCIHPDEIKQFVTLVKHEISPIKQNVTIPIKLHTDFTLFLSRTEQLCLRSRVSFPSSLKTFPQKLTYKTTSHHHLRVEPFSCTISNYSQFTLPALVNDTFVIPKDDNGPAKAACGFIACHIIYDALFQNRRPLEHLMYLGLATYNRTKEASPSEFDRVGYPTTSIVIQAFHDLLKPCNTLFFLIQSNAVAFYETILSQLLDKHPKSGILFRKGSVFYAIILDQTAANPVTIADSHGFPETSRLHRQLKRRAFSVSFLTILEAAKFLALRSPIAESKDPAEYARLNQCDIHPFVSDNTPSVLPPEDLLFMEKNVPYLEAVNKFETSTLSCSGASDSDRKAYSLAASALP